MFNDLNNDILGIIFSYLDEEDSQALAITCMKMFRIWKKSYSIESLLRKYIPDEILKSSILPLQKLFSEFCYKTNRSIKFTLYNKETLEYIQKNKTMFAIINEVTNTFMYASEDKIEAALNKIYDIYHTIQWLTPYKLVKFYYLNRAINRYRKKSMPEIKEYNSFKSLRYNYYDDFGDDPPIKCYGLPDVDTNSPYIEDQIKYDYDINGNYYKNKLRNELKKYKNNIQSNFNKIINETDDYQSEDKLLLNKLIDENYIQSDFEKYNLLLDDTLNEVLQL